MTETTQPISGGVAERKRRGLVADTVTRLVREKPLGTVGLIIVVIMLFAGIFADVIAPYHCGIFTWPSSRVRRGRPGSSWVRTVLAGTC